MVDSALHANLSEVASWYGGVPARLREPDVERAQQLAELIAPGVRAADALLRDGQKLQALSALRGLRGLLTKPGTGSILSLVRYPELEVESGRIYADFTTRLSELAAEVSSQPLDHAHLDELLAASRERARAERLADAEGAAGSSRV